MNWSRLEIPSHRYEQMLMLPHQLNKTVLSLNLLRHPNQKLRSSGGALLTIPNSRLKTKGDRPFAIRAPRLWNALPEEIRLAGSVNSFKSLLKTHFYRLAFLWCGPCVSIFTLTVFESCFCVILFIIFLLFQLLYLFWIITSVIPNHFLQTIYRPL